MSMVMQFSLGKNILKYVTYRDNEKGNIVRYQRPKKFQSIYIQSAEVFVTNLVLDVLCLDIYEYQSILDAAV